MSGDRQFVIDHSGRLTSVYAWQRRSARWQRVKGTESQLRGADANSGRSQPAAGAAVLHQAYLRRSSSSSHSRSGRVALT
jgi:hypothetical protein